MVLAGDKPLRLAGLAQRGRFRGFSAEEKVQFEGEIGGIGEEKEEDGCGKRRSRGRGGRRSQDEARHRGGNARFAHRHSQREICARNRTGLETRTM